MKFLVIILSLYITLLACTPCVDGDGVTFASTEVAAKDVDHSHDHTNDSCTPFCICSCCGIQVLNYTQPITYNPMVITRPAAVKETPSYKSQFISGYFGSIWQPPQLS